MLTIVIVESKLFDRGETCLDPKWRIWGQISVDQSTASETMNPTWVSLAYWSIREKLFLWIRLACACRSRGSWILVSVGSLCVVLQAVERLGRVNAGGWHAWMSNFSISNLFKLTNTDFVIYTLSTSKNTGPLRTFFSGQRAAAKTQSTAVRRPIGKAVSRRFELLLRSPHERAHCGLSLYCACFLTRYLF